MCIYQVNLGYNSLKINYLSVATCIQAHVEPRPPPPIPPHGLIKYMDTKTKCRHLKNLLGKGLCGR
jgi:hypothetical protein